ncbi:hypothetical protein CC80DRAFT_558567 [Byssothecium circinans]|uniref:Gamma-glutamylcyclotransferase n=1 Tax=Byssothecium circinans TaxID=147558 RepID=A0A6A5U3S1_9PLEO|nr:hypothetical protein CC80DRAFT_558567 [Byssothecium circinans]
MQIPTLFTILYLAFGANSSPQLYRHRLTGLRAPILACSAPHFQGLCAWYQPEDLVVCRAIPSDDRSISSLMPDENAACEVFSTPACEEHGRLRNGSMAFWIHSGFGYMNETVRSIRCWDLD